MKPENNHLTLADAFRLRLASVGIHPVLVEEIADRMDLDSDRPSRRIVLADRVSGRIAVVGENHPGRVWESFEDECPDDDYDAQ